MVHLKWTKNVKGWANPFMEGNGASGVQGSAVREGRKPVRPVIGLGRAHIAITKPGVVTL